MAQPKQVLHILSELTQPASLEQIQCDECQGQGEIRVFDGETGHELMDCPECLGSGYNTLGLIVKQILKPPAEGYGPTELRQALEAAQKEETQRQASQKTDTEPREIRGNEAGKAATTLTTGVNKVCQLRLQANV